MFGYLRKSDGVPMSGIEKALQNYLHPGLESALMYFLTLQTVRFQLGISDKPSRENAMMFSLP